MKALITSQQSPITVVIPISQLGTDSEDKCLARCGRARIPTLGYPSGVPSRKVPFFLVKSMGWHTASANFKTHFKLGWRQMEMGGVEGLSLPEKVG